MRRLPPQRNGDIELLRRGSVHGTPRSMPTSTSQTISKLSRVPPLNPHDAFLGGRTAVMSLYRVSENTLEEENPYVNVISECPWVN